MDFSFTEEQMLFRESVREWCRRNLTLERVREIDSKAEIPSEIIKGFGDLGLLCLTASRECGGSAADWVTAAIAAEELGYADISIATPVLYLVQAGWGWVLDKYGKEEVKKSVLPRAAKGEAFVGIGTTEPGGGSDVAAFITRAEKKGEHYVINGEKTYISGVEEAKRLGNNSGYLLLAGTKPELHHRGMTLFYLPIDTPGVEVSTKLEDMGRMGISTSGFTLRNVTLPDRNVIGDLEKGFYYVMEGFDRARMLVAATCIGAARRALELGMDYIKERRAFGRPIGKFEGIQFELADDYAELESAKWLVYHAAWMLDEMEKKRRFSHLEVSKHVSTAKLKVPPLAFEIFKHTMLWMGAAGYTKEYPLEMGLRGVMSYCIGAEGTLNIQRLIIARELLGKEYIPYR